MFNRTELITNTFSRSIFSATVCGWLLLGSTVASSQEDFGSYTILPGDVLQISVWKEPDLQLEVLVRPDGAISFPLAGDLAVRGSTVGELRDKLTERLQTYIADPVVTILVKEILGNKIYVLGQVTKPGVFVVNPQVDVMQALTMAGGGTPFASLDDIRILRRAAGVQTSIAFDYNAVVKGNDLSQNILLQSGDVVVVP